MKQIKKRRRVLRIGNPVGFSIFCLLVLALVAGLYVGISWAVKSGPAVVKAMRTAVQEEVLATPTVEPSPTPEEGLLPTATPTPNVDAPALGTPAASTPSPIPSAYVSAPPMGNITSPFYGQVIGLDPCRDGKSKFTSEAEYNLAYANNLKRYLEAQGATVILSRTNTSGSLSNEERAAIFKSAGCTAVIRLMCNHINGKTSACYAIASKGNKAYGQAIIDSYVAATGMKKQNGKGNGLETDSDSVSERCGCPCVLLILGNWDNSTDKTNLQDEVFMDRMNEGIATGLLSALGLSEPAAPPTESIE